MAQNITLMGASYSAVPAVTLPKTGGGTARFDDASVTTATASDVASGKLFLASDGTITTGTASGGGSSSWTKLGEHTYTGVSQTSTTATTIGTWSIGDDIWTSDKILYLRIRDKAGKRNGYFYGTDVWVLNMYPKNDSTATSMSNGVLMNIWSVTSSGAYAHRYGYSTTGYGIYPNNIYKNGSVRFSARYNSTYSLTINGDYKIEAYLLDPAGGVPIFT